MSLYPVKVWIDSEVMEAHADAKDGRFAHIHEGTYYVEARTEGQAEERALELYMREHVPKHVHAHAEKPIYVEKANPK